MISAISVLIWALCTGIFKTVVQPTANAGARERMSNAAGEFHGTLIPATPTGSLINMDIFPADHSEARPDSAYTRAEP